MFNYAKYTIKNINRRHDSFLYVLNKLLGKTYIKFIHYTFIYWQLHPKLVLQAVRAPDQEDCGTGPTRYHHNQSWVCLSGHNYGEITYHVEKMPLALGWDFHFLPGLEETHTCIGTLKMAPSPDVKLCSFPPQSFTHFCLACHDCLVFGDLKKVFIVKV